MTTYLPQPYQPTYLSKNSNDAGPTCAKLVGTNMPADGVERGAEIVG